MSLVLLYEKFRYIGDSRSPDKVDFARLYKISNDIIEYLLSSNPKELRSFIYALTEDDLYYMPYWMKGLIFKLIILEVPDDLQTLEKAVNHLTWFTDESNDFIVTMKKRILELSDPPPSFGSHEPE